MGYFTCEESGDDLDWNGGEKIERELVPRTEISTLNLRLARHVHALLVVVLQSSAYHHLKYDSNQYHSRGTP